MVPVNVECMVRKPEVVLQTGLLNDFPDARIVEFHHLPRVNIDQVVVLYLGKCLFKLGNIPPELVLDQ